ncbi:MFS transporter [Phenylobacterium sp.]|uniref:MFS transporter n=1 Tax=Phenylobacterium sp. TaxID=1871053 RepID=UPI0035B2747D
MAQDPAPQGRLSLGGVLAFCAPSIPVSALVLAIAVYLPRHFASHVGVSLAAVGGAFATVRMIDIGVDLALGLAMDRTRTQLGRYRLWFMIGVPILTLAVYMLFMAPVGVGVGYLITWLLVMYLGTSIFVLAHAAWASTLAPSYDERSRLFSFIAAVGVGGSVTVLLLPIVAKQLGQSDAAGVMAMGWFVVLLTPLTVALAVWRTPERVRKEDHSAHFRLRDYWELVSRPTMARIILADLCLALGPGWMSASYLFYFTDARGFKTDQASLLLAVYILAGFFGAPAIGRLATRISKHRAAMVASAGYSLLLLTLPLVPQGNMLIMAVPMFVLGFLAAGFTVLVRAMTADIGDEVRLEQGKERSGLLFAITTLTTKVAGAFSIFLTFNVLEAVGYVAKEGAVNTPQAIHGLELAYLIGPIAFVMAGGASFIGYRLDAKRHGEIRRQLEARDAAFDEAPIIQSVTGEPGIAAVPEHKGA